MSDVVRTYRMDSESGHLCTEDCACLFDPEVAGQAIDRHVRAYMLEHREHDYGAALGIVWPTLPTPLRVKYGLGGPMPWELPDEGEDDTAATEVHHRTEQRVKATGEDYAVALYAVLAADPHLAARYAGRDRRR